MKQTLKQYEIETDITVDYFDKKAYIYTCHQATKNKINALSKAHPEEAVIEKTDEHGVFAHAPINWIKIQPPRKSQPITEEKRQLLIDRLKKRREET